MKVRSIVAMVALLAFGGAFAQDSGISWESLSDGQREVLSPLEARWDSLPPARQRCAAVIPGQKSVVEITLLWKTWSNCEQDTPQQRVNKAVFSGMFTCATDLAARRLMI